MDGPLPGRSVLKCRRAGFRSILVEATSIVTSVADESLQFAEMIDEDVGRRFFERFRDVAIRDAARSDRCVSPRHDINSGITNHPCSAAITFGVG